MTPRWRTTTRVNGEVVDNTKIRCFAEKYGIMLTVNRISTKNSQHLYVEIDGDIPLESTENAETYDQIIFLLDVLLTEMLAISRTAPRKQPVSDVPPEGVLLKNRTNFPP